MEALSGPSSNSPRMEPKKTMSDHTSDDQARKAPSATPKSTPEERLMRAVNALSDARRRWSRASEASIVAAQEETHARTACRLAESEARDAVDCAAQHVAPETNT